MVVYDGDGGAPGRDSKRKRGKGDSGQPSNMFDEMLAELHPLRKRKREKIDLNKPIDGEKMTLDHIIRRANKMDRTLTQEAAEKAQAAKKESGGAAAADAAAAAPRPPTPPPAAQAPAVAPRLKLVDGELVIDPESLQIQAMHQRMELTHADDDDGRPVNSLSYLPISKLTKDRWSESDTELFYQVLANFGTDFSVMTHFFKGRTRKQIKNKYLKEQKINRDRVNAALSGGARDMESFRRMAAKVTTNDGADGSAGGDTDQMPPSAPIGSAKQAQVPVPAGAPGPSGVHDSVEDEEDDDMGMYTY